MKEVDELIKWSVASMGNCFLEVGTHMKNVVSRQPIPPALRKKIAKQILSHPDLYLKIKGAEFEILGDKGYAIEFVSLREELEEK